MNDPIVRRQVQEEAANALKAFEAWFLLSRFGQWHFVRECIAHLGYDPNLMPSNLEDMQNGSKP